MKQVALLLADGFEEVEAITVADYLRRAGIKVYLTSLLSTTVTGSHQVTLIADKLIDQLPDNLDAVIVPGGMPGASNLAQSEQVIKLIRNTFDDNKLVAAICAAPALVLAKSGVLNEREFTFYPGFEKQLVESGWKADIVVQDGNIITSRGPGTAAEFTFAIIEYLLGQQAAHAVKQATLHNG
jgi:4-methyl-5(b-hydroxyethyl)-thiazole monophosphate biosynthesis